VNPQLGYGDSRQKLAVKVEQNLGTFGTEAVSWQWTLLDGSWNFSRGVLVISLAAEKSLMFRTGYWFGTMTFFNYGLSPQGLQFCGLGNRVRKMAY